MKAIKIYPGIWFAIVFSIVVLSCKEEHVNLLPQSPSLSQPFINAIQVNTNTSLIWQKVTDPNGDEIVYNVFLGTDSLNMPLLGSKLKETSFSPTLLPHEKYFWKVVASDGNGGEAESSVWNFSTDNYAPDTVILNYPKNEPDIVDYMMNFSWLASSDRDGDELYYRLFVDTLPEPQKMVVEQTELNFEMTLTPNTNYFWKVIVIDKFGGEKASEIMSFTTKMGPPSDFTLLGPKNSVYIIRPYFVFLNWNASQAYAGTYPIITYDLYLDTIPDLRTAFVSEMRDTSYKLTQLNLNTTYYWKVVAKDEQGNLVESEMWSFYVEEPQLKTGLVTDPRDRHVYKTVTIGDETWMAENLNYYIPDNSYCYNDSSSYCDVYGKFYNWETAMTACPEGWSVPTVQQWDALIESVATYGYSGQEGVALKSETGWKVKEGSSTSATVNGTNALGFNVLPSGRMTANGYMDLGFEAQFWTSTPEYVKGMDAVAYYHFRWYYDTVHHASTLSRSDIYKNVRCIKNK